MHGLKLSTGPMALFLSREKAENAIKRLAFIAKGNFYATRGRYSERGEIKGWTVTVLEHGKRHQISDADVDRFGL